MRITPDVNLLKSIRGHRVDYVIVACEAVDNAFDATATVVEVTINDDEISFRDDGIGLNRKRIMALFSLGRHEAMTSTALGRFGVGITHQAINAGNIFKVISTSLDGSVLAEVDWREVLKSGEWAMNDPRWRPCVVGSPTGTRITISDLQAAKRGWQSRIVNELAERFHPALAEGRRLIVNGEQVPLLPEPEMSDVATQQIHLSGGRSADIRAGILVKPSKLHSVHVGYKHRTIMPTCGLGCSNYGGLNKMFARVQLAGPWHLETFKNDLPNEDEREELEEAVLEVLRPILEKCNAASMSAKITEISRELNDLVPPELSPARPKREKDKLPAIPGEKKGGRGKVAAEKSDPLGPARSKRPPQNKLVITFDGDAEYNGVGAFVAGRPHRVNLSKDDPYVARLLEHRDHRLGLHALYALAIMLFEQGRSDPEPDMFDPYGKRIASLLAIQDESAWVERGR